MICNNPEVHSQIVRVAAQSTRRCGCPVVAPIVKSVAPVAATASEDRFPR